MRSTVVQHGAAQILEQLAQRVEEAAVLGRRADRSTRSPPSRPSALPARTSTLRSARPSTIARSPRRRAVAERVNQRKFACDVGGLEPQLAQPSSSRAARRSSARRARAISSWCLAPRPRRPARRRCRRTAGAPGRPRCGSAPRRTARSRRAGRRARRPSRTCAAARGSGGARSRSSDASGSSSSVELAVGLVEDHADVARDLAR